MKNATKKTMLLVMIAAVSVLMVAQIANAVILGSKHDLKAVGSSTEICVYCHTPHFSGTAAPLWNRAASGASYTMYTSDSLRGVIQTAPKGVSAACLSCHDGATAYDNLLNMPGSGLGTPVNTGTKMTGLSTMLLDGTNSLKNDHPISITYATANGLNTFTPSTATTRGKVTGTTGDVPLFTTAGIINQVECASCHNVHEPGVIGTTAPFLRVSNAASALCLACHAK